MIHFFALKFTFTTSSHLYVRNCATKLNLTPHAHVACDRSDNINNIQLFGKRNAPMIQYLLTMLALSLCHDKNSEKFNMFNVQMIIIRLNCVYYVNKFHLHCLICFTISPNFRLKL